MGEFLSEMTGGIGPAFPGSKRKAAQKASDTSKRSRKEPPADKKPKAEPRVERDLKTRNEEAEKEQNKENVLESTPAEKKNASEDKKSKTAFPVLAVVAVLAVTLWIAFGRRAAPAANEPSNSASDPVAASSAASYSELPLSNLYPDLKTSYGGYPCPEPDGTERLVCVNMQCSTDEIIVCTEPEYDEAGSYIGAATRFDGAKSFAANNYDPEIQQDEFGRLIKTGYWEYDYAEDGRSYTITHISSGSEREVRLEDRQIADYIKRDQSEYYHNLSGIPYNEDGFPLQDRPDSEKEHGVFDYHYDLFENGQLKAVKRDYNHNGFYITLLEFDEHGYLTQYLSQLNNPFTFTYEYEALSG